MPALCAALITLVGTSPATAQNNNRDNRDRGGRPQWDPAQMQQRIMEGVKERLEITDEGEWKVMQPLVQKVLDTQREVSADRMRGMMGGRRPGGDAGGSSRSGGMFGTPSKEAETLQKAIDSKASAADLKSALAKFIESRKAHQAELERAQDELRKVLSARQEAIATASGLL